MDYKLLIIMRFEVITVTSIDSQEPACCDDGHLLASSQSWCEHAAYLISRVLEALNSTEYTCNSFNTIPYVTA